ncbi:hypothetical protein CCC_01715 [Paramagnetospirillum magnetotacticum MS-1]|uniref:Uncharacterized protein n=1 Tax=Paramagnetospirillum magnetotacticum MS-1 TaxID=272627 RepID=A0A0C2YAQ9_PARME|nr:hypothetical protein CCC_01715 [Paramagnetospirillum magnetotacticum MS-1]
MRDGRWRLLANASGEAGYVRVLPDTDGGWHRIGYGRWGDLRWNGCEYVSDEDTQTAYREVCRPIRSND